MIRAGLKLVFRLHSLVFKQVFVGDWSGICTIIIMLIIEKFVHNQMKSNVVQGCTVQLRNF